MSKPLSASVTMTRHNNVSSVINPLLPTERKKYEKILIPFFMAAVIGTTSLTASANPWRPENNEHKQPTLVDISPELPDMHAKCESDDSAWSLFPNLKKFVQAHPTFKRLSKILEKLM